MGCCFCPSFFSSKLESKAPAPLSDVYLSPLPKSSVSEVREAQPPPARSEIQPVHQVATSNSISQTQQKIQICDDEKDNRGRMHFDVKVIALDEDARSRLKSLEADSKQSSGEGESHDSLFSLQLVDGWRTANEEEVMSKQINSSNVSTDLVAHLTKDEDEGFTFSVPIQGTDQNEESEKTNQVPGASYDDLKGESSEVSVDSSLSSWLVEPENNTPMSRHVPKSCIIQKPNGDSGNRRRVLGELSLVEVNPNPGQNLKNSSQEAKDSDMCYYGPSMENVTQEIRRLRRISLSKHEQKVDLHKAIPLGLSLARAAMCTGLV